MAGKIVGGVNFEEANSVMFTVSRWSMCRNGAGTWIRNEFNFWTPECPLTKEWHEDSKNNTNKYIDEHGTDNHPKHPDAVSPRSFEKIMEYYS